MEACAPAAEWRPGESLAERPFGSSMLSSLAYISRGKATSNFSARTLTMPSLIRSQLRSAHIAIGITSLGIPFWWNVALHYSARGARTCAGLACHDRIDPKLL